MKIVILESSPNKNGSSNYLAEQFIQGAEDAGHSVQVIDVAHANIHPCTGCIHISGGTGKAQPMQEKPLPLVCITTTAGTGSEADQWGVITNDETNEKIGFGGYDELFPVLSIVDPELMISVPAEFTAYQGFDALFHSTECYISNTHSLMSDMYAKTAIENVGKYLVRAVKNGTDIEAREGKLI